ncbi:NACHT domain-containing protein [Actinacidiphila alni]|uniref:NACHT domain-containing protein n=1 Tax=Actinacidiphila alni TaxID=380248 RepID=UPI003451E247
MKGDVFGFHMPRVCRVRGQDASDDPIPVPDQPFRADGDELVGGGGGLTEGALALPRDVAAAGAMVVLGEPGAGKTSVLRDLTAGLPRVEEACDGDSDTCLWVSGADLTEVTYSDEVGRHLEALPRAGEAAQVTGVLTVVLDQADEISFLRSLPGRLTRSLNGRDTSRVRFLMACRTADYSPRMTSVLNRAFGACRCVDLAPLSREEAIALADSAAGVVGTELVEAAEQAGAAVLASVPLTLELLVLVHRSGDGLSGTPENLFARGVAHLVEEPDTDRLGQPATTTAPQRLRIAGRIAAWMLLSGRRNVWKGGGLEAGPLDLQGGELAGGFEQGPAGSYEVKGPMLRETLATALFTASGEHRVAFRHSSVAAYLAARYLTECGATQSQLENLLLARSPAGDTASVPPPLRETAAWLVALRPAATEWLANADPESLAVHSALVRSNEVRRLTVARLLERASEVELGDARWQLSQWDLHHPMLADQLADALHAARTDQAGDWHTVARIRVAVRLAQEAGIAHARLADCLLRVVDDDRWHQTERRLAARAAFSCDIDRSVPILTRVLASLNDPILADAVDRDHDLRGTALVLLWPEHLDTAAMLAALRPPAPRHYNAYNEFLRTMAGRSTDAQLPDILSWARDAVRGADATGALLTFEPHSSETDWINSLIDRALRSEDPEQHMVTLAEIILTFLRKYHAIRVPECLQPDQQGEEPVAIQLLRRRLATALAEEAAASDLEPRHASWALVNDWEYQPPFQWNAHRNPERSVRRQLLDTGDFAWARDQVVLASSGAHDKLVAVYGELAAVLFPRDDEAAFDSAYDPDHPAWPYLSGFYDPIVLDSPLAEALRHNLAANTEETWPQAAEHAAMQARLLEQAKTGTYDRFWLFLWNLRADPNTGRFASVTSDDIRQWPGTLSFRDDLADLTDLALGYLSVEHDHRDGWLGQSKTDKRSWAGYLMLLEVHRAERLDELPLQVWDSWATAILTEMPTGGSSFTEPARIDLLRRAALHAPNSLADCVTRFASDAIEHGWQPIQLNPIDPAWAPELRVAIEDLATRLTPLLDVTPMPEKDGSSEGSRGSAALSAPDTDEARQAVVRIWSSLLGALLTAESPRAHSIVETALSGPRNTQTATQAAVQAGRLLLAADAQTYWPRIKQITADDLGFGRELAYACKQDTTHHTVQSTLPEAELVELYLWLCTLYVPEDDPPVLSIGWVSAAQEVRNWRDVILRELSQRATAEAIRELRRLTDQYPDRLAIAAALIAATRQYATATWEQVRLEDVTRVLRDRFRRIIRDSSDLLDVVYETLEHIADELPSHCELLWDRTRGKPAKKATATTSAVAAVPDTWRPKPEAALSAYIAHELNLRLAGHKISVNREVLILPTNPYGSGDRTDILIEAHPTPGDDPDAAEPGPVKLVIELKGPWNPGITTAMETQLADRYLPEAKAAAGIYLVGWYPIELWNVARDTNRTRAKKWTYGTLTADLRAQASALSDARAVRLKAAVITIPRPHR